MRKCLAVGIVVIGLGCAVFAEQAATDDQLASAMPIASALPTSGIVPRINALPSAMAPVTIVPTAPLANSMAPGTTPQEPGTHDFWDKRNLAIFASVAAARTMDPISTWQFRRHGLNEGELTNAFVDNKPLFATYSASLLVGQISLSYMFHRLGWHKLERFSAMAHTAATTEAVIHNYRIGTAH